MNSCILMAKIVRRPELRYTQDNQTPYAQMLVEFNSSRPEEPPATLKVVAWRNLAAEVSENYNEGDHIIIEGRLSMQMSDRPEGFKEKRAELTVSHIYPLNGEIPTTTPSNDVEKEKVVSMNSYKQKPAEPRQEEKEEPAYELPKSSRQPVAAPVDQDLDDIPFMRSVDSKTVSAGLLDSYELDAQCPQVGVSHNFKFT